MLRSPLSKINISKIIPSNNGAFKSVIVCPLCKRPQIAANVTQTLRLQSTNTKVSILRQQMKKKKKKVKMGEYSELIQVAESSGSKVKESRAVIKKSSSKEVLQSLGVNVNPLKKNSQNVISELDKASESYKINSVTNGPATIVPTTLSESNQVNSLTPTPKPLIKPRSMLMPVPRANIINASKKLNEKETSSKKQLLSENQVSKPLPQFLATSVSVANLDSTETELKVPVSSDNITVNNTYTLENVPASKIGPLRENTNEMPDDAEVMNQKKIR